MFASLYCWQEAAASFQQGLALDPHSKELVRARSCTHCDQSEPRHCDLGIRPLTSPPASFQHNTHLEISFSANLVVHQVIAIRDFEVGCFLVVHQFFKSGPSREACDPDLHACMQALHSSGGRPIQRRKASLVQLIFELFGDVCWSVSNLLARH